jgi:anti-sigma-K factor RskA
MSDHEQWDELAAGYALDALEPEETAVFTDHLRTCELCTEAVADHALVAAQLGTLAGEAGQAPAWSSVRTGVLGAPVVSLEERRSRRRLSVPQLTSAAAALLVAAGAVVWTLGGSDPQSLQDNTLAACSRSSDCHVVALQDKAKLVVQGSSVRMLPEHLPAPPTGRVYVLWQLPPGGDMTLVGSLQQTASGAVGEVHDLALPFDRTEAFGLSLEPASGPRIAPSDVVAVGPA